MKKRYVSLIIIAIILLVLAGVGYFASNHHTVIFSFKNGNYNIEINNSKGKKVSTINTKDSSAWLWKGNYSYKVIGDKYDNSDQKFSINDDDKEISVNPNYSDDYLAGLLTSSEYDAITSELNPYLRKVPSGDVSMRSLSLYARGQWAAGTFSYQGHSGEIPEIYRFVLEKTNSWKVIVKPSIAIYSGDYPQIPLSVLNHLY